MCILTSIKFNGIKIIFQNWTKFYEGLSEFIHKENVFLSLPNSISSQNGNDLIFIYSLISKEKSKWIEISCNLMSSMTNLDCLNCDQFGEICSGLYKLILNWCIETFSIVRGRISLFIFCFDFFFNYLWSKFQLFGCLCIYQKNQFNL